MKMNRKQLIKKYLEFFKRKNHKEIPNKSLVPENDPTVLFTTAGMHPLVPYLLGQKHPLGKRLVNVQRCIRTGDIDDVGDEVHHTFFEMLGNWSLGDYWKKEAIEYSFEFLTKELGIEDDRLAVSCFKGDKDAPKDSESAEVWKRLGVSEDRILFLGKEDNWWGPAGKTGPCGPDTEMFYWKGNKSASPPTCFDINNKNWVEIWNDVLMQYVKDEKGNYKEALQKNVDTGMGVERTIAVLNGLDDDYLTDCFLPIIKKIEKLSNKSYKGNERDMRIIADHVKAGVFIIGDGVVPSNVERGYVLRRLIRRAVRYGRKIGLKNFVREVGKVVFEIYDDYDILENKKKIIEELEKEERRFLETLERGLRVFEKMAGNKKIDGKEAFLLYQSYGFPIEITLEIAKEKGIRVDEKEFEKESEKHQSLSRTATEGKFKSGLADKSEETTRMHTAAHLLLAALNEVLGKEIVQKGSNITAERLRFDFNFDRKLTEEEKRKIENLVNKKIKENLEVKKEEMSVKDAKKSGAQGVFEGKYGDKVFVYSIGDFSKEICAGPHVSRTGELGKFRIVKEESSSAGVRRVKGVLE